jgi:hypothetical protein
MTGSTRNLTPREAAWQGCAQVNCELATTACSGRCEVRLTRKPCRLPLIWRSTVLHAAATRVEAGEPLAMAPRAQTSWQPRRPQPECRKTKPRAERWRSWLGAQTLAAGPARRARDELCVLTDVDERRKRGDRRRAIHLPAPLRTRPDSCTITRGRTSTPTTRNEELQRPPHKRIVPSEQSEGRCEAPLPHIAGELRRRNLL